MISSIINQLLSTTTLLQWPNFVNLNQRITLNVKNLINYKQKKTTWIDSANTLVSFVELFPKTNLIKDYEKLESVYTQAIPLANRFNMANITNSGSVIDGAIFNGRSKEQWIAILQSPNRPLESTLIKPIRCIWHPFTSLNFWMDEDVLDYSPLVSFFIVDLMGLSLSINKFYKSNNDFSSKEYISQIIIPSLIEDIANITLFNRLNNQFLEKSMLNVYDKKRLTPTWYDLCQPIDVEYLNILETISNQNEGIDFIAQNIPLISNTKLIDFLYNLPQIPSVKNIFSTAMCAICPYLNFILYLNKITYGIENRTFNNMLKLELMIMKNDNSLLSDDKILKKQQKGQFEIMSELL